MNNENKPESVVPDETTGKLISSLIKKHAGIANVSKDGKQPLNQPQLIALNDGGSVEDVTKHYLTAAQTFKPLRRQGTAVLKSLDSIIKWSNRFKGSNSVAFLNRATENQHPTIEVVIDYHHEGEPETAEIADKLAEKLKHRGLFKMKYSDQWNIWNSRCKEPLDQMSLGHFLEENCFDVLDPTPNLIKGNQNENNANWENAFLDLAKKIGGRFATLQGLMLLSKTLKINENNKVKTSINRDTGEHEIAWSSEHQDSVGKPLIIPNLFIIAIPIFEGGDPYRLPVRFSYRKTGSGVEFYIKIHNAKGAIDSSFKEHEKRFFDETNIPVLDGRPES